MKDEVLGCVSSLGGVCVWRRSGSHSTGEEAVLQSGCMGYDCSVSRWEKNEHTVPCET